MLEIRRWVEAPIYPTPAMLAMQMQSFSTLCCVFPTPCTPYIYPTQRPPSVMYTVQYAFHTPYTIDPTPHWCSVVCIWIPYGKLFSLHIHYVCPTLRIPNTAYTLHIVCCTLWTYTLHFAYPSFTLYIFYTMCTLHNTCPFLCIPSTERAIHVVYLSLCIYTLHYEYSSSRIPCHRHIYRTLWVLYIMSSLHYLYHSLLLPYAMHSLHLVSPTLCAPNEV